MQHLFFRKELMYMNRNEEIRRRLKAYIAEFGTPLATIARATGHGENRSLFSRFMRGKDLWEDSLNRIDDYLSKKGF